MIKWPHQNYLMTQDKQDKYPQSEFLNDFLEWHSYPIGNGDQRIQAVFPLRYPNPDVCAYRVKRLRCVVAAIQKDIEKLAQDGIMRPEQLPGRTTIHLSNRLVLALHIYYGGINENALQTLPPPEWPSVMKIYDDLKEI
jgi:hypothetical protein